MPHNGCLCVFDLLRAARQRLVCPMPSFAENLSRLPSVEHLSALELLDAQGHVVATIPNQPGKTGSLTIYAALAAAHGGAITAGAAQQGLELFGEHTAAACAHPGSHPNIDRLLAIIASGQPLQVRTVPASAPHSQ